MSTSMNERELEKAFKAVANRRRLAILRYLKNNQEGTVGDIAHEIKLSFTSTSKHLRLLSIANLVDREQRALEGYYRLSNTTSDTMRRILNIL